MSDKNYKASHRALWIKSSDKFGTNYKWKRILFVLWNFNVSLSTSEIMIWPVIVLNISVFRKYYSKKTWYFIRIVITWIQYFVSCWSLVLVHVQTPEAVLITNLTYRIPLCVTKELRKEVLLHFGSVDSLLFTKSGKYYLDSGLTCHFKPWLNCKWAHRKGFRFEIKN